MKQRTTALLLAAALALALLGTAALAEEGGAPGAASAQPEAVQPYEPEDSTSPDASAAPAEGEPNPEGEEGAPAEDTESETSEEPQEEEYIPDPVGAISFQNLERRMREGNLSLLALEENIQAIQVIDYDKLEDNLRKGMNAIADQQWMLTTTIPGMGSMMAASLDSQYDALRKTFDDIREGKLQKDNAGLVWQLENAQNQVVMAGETLYIALLDLENTGRGLDRQLTALDRTLQELDLRYQLGHISSQTLKQTQAGRTALVSGRQTLSSNIQTCKMQLELLIGAELTGNLRLSALPQVTGAELEAMDLEADLEAAKAASYSLYDAGQTLEDAREDYKDAKDKYGPSERRYEFLQAKHQWQAAQYNYDSTVQNYEMSFRTLYLQVKDYKQVLDAARTALAVEKDNCAVSQLKHSQGKLSQNALLEAQDKVTEAQEKVDSAAIDLFTAYHNYRWAVDYGILN